VVTAAFAEINKQIIQNKGILKTCNAAFAKLLGGRDFTAVWKDSNIWVSYKSNPEEPLFGITYGKDVAAPEEPLPDNGLEERTGRARLEGRIGWPAPSRTAGRRG